MAAPSSAGADPRTSGPPAAPPRHWAKRRLLEWADRVSDDEVRRRLEALQVRENEFGFDPFGFSRDDLRIALVLARWIYRHYFRCEVHGIQNVPVDGPVLIVANHSGQLPYDGLCIAAAVFLDHDPPRMLRAMMERWIPQLPFISYLFNRWGQILGEPDNCRRLLRAGEAILVFPEGARGISKPFTRRYQLEPFGTGFMRLALETRTPIVPVAVVGAEEQAPAINVKPLAKIFGWPAFPVMPVPPFLPIVPLPTKYHLWFGEPLRFSGDPDDDEEEIRRHVRVVEHAVTSMIQVGLKERRGVFG